MPQELKQVNGRWVVSGAQKSSDLVPAPKPPAQRVRPQSARPAAPRPQARPQPRPWWSKLGNDLQYELNQLKTNPLNSIDRLARTHMRYSVGGIGFQQGALGMAGANDNLQRLGYSMVQRMQGKKKADPSSGRYGAGLDRVIDQAYRFYGATPPSQMSQEERGVDQFRRSFVGNLMAGPMTPGLGAAKAATGLGMFVRGGTAFAINEALSTAFDDSTGGNPVDFINSLTGAKLPGGINVGVDDMVDAYVKSLAPNATSGLVVGLGAGVAVSGFRNIRRNVRAHRAVKREAAQRAKQESMGFLQKDEADAYDFTLQAKQAAPAEPAPAPAPAAAPEPTFQEANAAMEQRLGMTQPEAAPAPTIADATTENFGKAQPADLPEADPAIDYWTYDPELPESTALGNTLEELSDQELITVVSNPGLPVVERVNQAIEARAAVEPRPPVATEMVMAPADRLAEDYLATVTRKLGAREDYELRPLFDPEANPQLWQRAQAITGVDDPSQLSKADMLDSIGAMAADGQVPIVNRMMGGQMLPTGEVQAAPKVFQYKGGVNEAGEQIGNSLEGVERWDPNAENIIQVWRDVNGELGQPGVVYVVNGHNRLAAAKRMGIPSIRVEYLDAPTAAEARLQGAISNVSDGKGTVFDAAKLAREYGITDQAQLKALGKPGASGFWKEGIALGRLPEDVFTAAVNEQIPLRRAVIIGEAGVDEETMRSAYRYLVQQGPDNVKEGILREMLAMASRSPSASSSDGVQGTILDGTEWGQSFNEGLLAKADLASSVRLMLSKEKKLFGTVGRQSGQIERVGQVDAGAAKEISGEAGRALNIFDNLKYQTGPVGDLLNEGTARVLAGEQPAAVAKGIKNRLAAAISEAMGKEVAPAADVVQEDMFAAATRAADEPQGPIELTPDERLALEAQALQEGISNGEVRPPATPLPELPEPAQVRLDEITNSPAVMAARRLQERMRQQAIKAGAIPMDDLPPMPDKPAGWTGKAGAERRAADAAATRARGAEAGRRVDEALGEVVLDPAAVKPYRLMEAARKTSDPQLAADYRAAAKLTEAELEAISADSLEIVNMDKLAQATADEVRLAIEHKQSDAALAWDQELTARDAEGYHDLTFAEKQEIRNAVAGVPDVKIEPIEVDTRGKGEFFHGAAKEFSLNRGGEFEGDGMNIYGDGLYVTDDIKTAARYQKKNAGGVKEGNVVYRVTELTPVRLYDLDQKLSWPTVKALRSGLSPDGEELMDAALDGFDGLPSLAELMDEMRASSRSLEMPAYEVQEEFFGMQAALEKQGFGGYTHQGGKLAGKGKRLHQVRIYWDPAEKVALEKVDAQPAPITPEVMPPNVPISQLPKLSDKLGEMMRAMAESDARLFREIDGLTKTTRRAINELSGLADAPVRPEPLKLTAGAAQPEFTLPQELSKSAPRYGRYTVRFESDLDRAAYVLANDAVKPSKAADKFRAAIEAAGMSPAEVVAHGKRVKAALKQAAKGNLTGQVDLPSQPFGDVAKPPTRAGADRVRQQIEVNTQTMDDIRRKAQQEGC